VKVDLVDDGIMLGGPYAAFIEEQSPFPLIHMPPPPIKYPGEGWGKKRNPAPASPSFPIFQMTDDSCESISSQRSFLRLTGVDRFLTKKKNSNGVLVGCDSFTAFRSLLKRKDAGHMQHLDVGHTGDCKLYALIAVANYDQQGDCGSPPLSAPLRELSPSSVGRLVLAREPENVSATKRKFAVRPSVLEPQVRLVRQRVADRLTEEDYQKLKKKENTNFADYSRAANAKDAATRVILLRM